MTLLAVAFVAGLTAAYSLPLRAQSPASGADSTAHPVLLADRGPAFFAIPQPGSSPVDVRDADVFRRRVSLTVVDVSLDDALDAITRQTGLQFAFRKEAVAAAPRVSLDATNLRVSSALTELLADTHLDVELTGPEQVTLVLRKLGPGGLRLARQPNAGILSGRVTDAATHGPLDQVAVRIEGPGLGAVTTSDGHYTVRNVPPATYRVTARRVGYTPLTKTVVIGADSMASVDFMLAAAPTKLNEVVTTAVGDQRRYEVGNTIATINADSIAPNAPVTSLTDLISARAPGVEVMETSGMTGAGGDIRIRGTSSLVLQSDPILIVDGVRQDNSAGGDVGVQTNQPFNSAHPTPARLNDLDVSDIESIDILKGPSASTEYGTDAANGVIVIRTKRGQAGAPQWRVSVERTTSDIPESFPNGYYSWGHTTDGTHTLVDCPLVPSSGGTYGSTVGTCAVDSVTRWNPLNHAAYSIFGTGNRAKYDLSVSGGSEALRYFIAGGLSNEIGIVQMPSAFRQLADTAALGVPAAARVPNREEQRSVRVNTALRVGPAADLAATGSYLSTYQQTPDAGFSYQGTFVTPALSDAAHYYGYGYPFDTPIAELTELGFQQTDRVTGGLTANWRPTGWLAGHATVGLDHGSAENHLINYPLTQAAFEDYFPFLALGNATTNLYTVDARGTATVALNRSVRTVTSMGAQMVDRRIAGQSAGVASITATNLTLNGAATSTVTQVADRDATLGGYGEEQLSLADRLFVTGAVRVDAGSGFGRAYAVAAYPKASISWLVLANGSTNVRLRAAYGESGVQPTNGAAFQLYQPATTYTVSGPASVYQLSWPGNAGLKPERTGEFEGGADIGLWENRLSVEWTVYVKNTRDALVDEQVPDVGGYAYQQNIGQVRNAGVEGSVTVALVKQGPLMWDVTLSGSVNHNELISLAHGVAAQVVSGQLAQFRQATGYPLYSLWGPPVAYADKNHDGVIEPNEVTVGDSARYVGPSQPTQEVSVATRLALWRGTVMVTGLADYRGGYRIANSMAYLQALAVQSAQAQNDPHAPLWDQARYVAAAVGPCCAELAPFMEDGSFLRVRELGFTYALPLGIARQLRVRNLSITGAVRNLALWTNYTGIDPEVSNTVGTNRQLSPTTNGATVNNDVRESSGAVPLARYWLVRLNLGL